MRVIWRFASFSKPYYLKKILAKLVDIYDIIFRTRVQFPPSPILF
ncbi:hypothetical protein BHW_0900074 [Borrelia hermsii MTW]|nr:hypothetical protein BHW_0900074 [Borrelia hermsii MTW]